MAEYVKGVGLSEENGSAQPKAESSYMGVDDADEAPAQPAAEPKQEAPGAGKFGAWVSAEGDGAESDGDADMADAEEEQEVDKDEALIHEKAIGRGQYPLQSLLRILLNSEYALEEFMVPPILGYHKADTAALGKLSRVVPQLSTLAIQAYIAQQDCSSSNAGPRIALTAPQVAAIMDSRMRRAVCLQALVQPWSC